MNEMCGFFGISRAAYYAWRKPMDRTDPDQERLQLKEEALRQIKIPTLEEAKQVVKEYIYFYNYERI